MTGRLRARAKLCNNIGLGSRSCELCYLQSPALLDSANCSRKEITPTLRQTSGIKAMRVENQSLAASR